MKKPSSKKGFSLIELIVVIAVIAAIAAVIVPSITNMSGAAKVTADKRNVQLWNQTYLDAYAAGANMSSFVGTAGSTNLPAIGVTINVGGQNVNFNSPAINLAVGNLASFNNDVGAVYQSDSSKL